MAREQVFPAAPALGPGGRILAAPFQFLLTGDDRLRIVSFNSLTGVVVAIQGYRMDPAGEKHPLRQVHTPNTDRTVATDDFALGAGALLNLTVFAAAGAPLIGQTFVILQLVRGVGAAAVVLGTLLAGYVTARQPLGWPGSPIVSSLEGEPVIRVVTGTDPAAGAEVSETVPTGARWELLSVRYTLVTSAVAGARRSRLVLTTPGSAVFVSLLPATTQAASDNLPYLWAPNLPSASIATTGLQQPLTQRAILPAGAMLGTSTQAVDAGDNYADVTFAVREWLEAA